MRGEDTEANDRRAAFSLLPGTHVHVRSSGGAKKEFVQSDGTLMAATYTYWRRNPLFPNPRVAVRGRVFEERSLGKRRNNHMRTPREVIDLETGARIFRIDGLNFNGAANAVISFSESRWYSFPVEGTKCNFPEMTASDSEGRVALRFGGICALGAEEVVISPEQSITTELLTMMATASPFLPFFFLKPGD